MSTLFWLQHKKEIPVAPELIRTSVMTVDSDAPSAIEDMLPETQERPDTDAATPGGLKDRSLGSFEIAPVHYPHQFGNAGVDFGHSLREQISSAGATAARELTGRWGHGTLRGVFGMEPAPLAVFGEDYFTTDQERRLPEISMEAAQGDALSDERSSAQARANASDATAKSPMQRRYEAFMAGGA
jgi:hypothetical protein